MRGNALDQLVPKLVTTLKGYTRPQLFADVTAGVIVGIVASPPSAGSTPRSSAAS